MPRIYRQIGLAVAAASAGGCVAAAGPAGEAPVESRPHQAGQVDARLDAQSGHSQGRGQIEDDPGVRLGGDEIRALLVGRTLSHDVERATRLRMSGMITPYQEGFRADGTVWVRLDRGATMSGRYEISRDQLCLALNNGTQECRHLFRAVDGGLIQRDSRGAPESTTPIIVE